MKVIFCKTNPQTYENINVRKSYINILDGAPQESQSSMKTTQNEYFAPFFPTQDEIDTIANNFNYNASDNTRTLTIRRSDFKEIYPDTFEFWNNVNYVKIVHDSDFEEYCYITSRTCDNLAVNLWTFNLAVDVWNTYWITVYQSFLSAHNVSLHVNRLHEERFQKYGGINYFKFLNTQDSSFWNKDTFEESINSKITIETGQSITPWQETDSKYIFSYQDLFFAYGGFQGNLGFQRFFETPVGRNGFPTLVYTVNEGSLSNILRFNKSWYGLNNPFLIAPLVNAYILKDDGRLTDDYKDYGKYFGAPSDPIFDANRLNRAYNSAEFIGIIQTPKPILPLKTFASNSYQNFTYPNRHNDYLGANIEPDYLQATALNLSANDVSGTIIVNNDYETKFSLGVEPLPFYDHRNSFLNGMCDERIDASNFVDKLFLNPESKVIQNTNIELEPKLYDDNLFNVVYSHYNQDKLIISPKWYFYQNFEDIENYNSIFIEGYQFVSTSFVSLTQYLTRGLYYNYNIPNIQNGLNSIFSPWVSFNKSTMATFLANNANAMNTSLNNLGNKSIINTLLSAGIGFGVNWQAGLIATISSYIVSQNNINMMKNTQHATLSDISNSPTNSSDMSSSNTFKMMNAENGGYSVNWISDIDKERVWNYHNLNGYLLNKSITLNSLVSRLRYNFWQISNFKMALQNCNIADDFKNYFENLFLNGVMLFHESFNIDNTRHKILVSDYSFENWELSLWDDLNKE